MENPNPFKTHILEFKESPSSFQNKCRYMAYQTKYLIPSVLVPQGRIRVFGHCLSSLLSKTRSKIGHLFRNLKKWAQVLKHGADTCFIKP